jgi:hypothetical protein
VKLGRLLVVEDALQAALGKAGSRLTPAVENGGKRENVVK